jgi:hypothetical protein
MKPTNAPSSVAPRNVSVERPFFPTPSQRTVCPSACSRRSSAKARRITCALNAPASPRSPVSGTISVVASSRAAAAAAARGPSRPRGRRRDQLAHRVGVRPHRLDPAWRRRSFAAATSSSAA